MLRTLTPVVSFLALIGLFAYPVLYVTFPWTIPVTYLAALVVAMFGLVVGVCR